MGLVLSQHFLGCLAHASYLVADDASGRAVVVDPQRDVDVYLDEAQQRRLQITDVLLTHFHADFLAGHLELQARAGATIRLGAVAKAEYPFVPMVDGTHLDLGPSVRLHFLATPGHTPESTSIVVQEHVGRGWHPHAVLTGDTLFIGDIGRPDLLVGVGCSPQQMASDLYDSLHTKLLVLPDSTLVYPAHGAGSMCGRHLSEETSSTIGIQRQFNAALQPMAREAFVAMAVADLPEAPAYFSYDAVLNTKQHPTLQHVLSQTLRPLSLDEVLERLRSGAQLLDAREPMEFSGAHLRGAINIGLAGTYASWAGTLFDPTRPIILVAEPGTEQEASTRLARIGFDQVAGFLAGAMAALSDQPQLVQRTKRVTAATLAEQLRGHDAPLVLDVRTKTEFDKGHIAGSTNIPLAHLRKRIAEVPQHGRLVVHCHSGYRSSIAQSVLAPIHQGPVEELVGGFLAWEAAGLPTARQLPTA